MKSSLGFLHALKYGTLIPIGDYRMIPFMKATKMSIIKKQGKKNHMIVGKKWQKRRLDMLN